MKIRDELTPYFCETYEIDRDKDYPVEWVDPRTLLVSERLDLVAKLKYIEAYESGRMTPFIKDCYIQHIAAFSYGTFKESGSKEKDSIEKYLVSFHQLIDAIKTTGFDAAKSLIPVGKDNILLDGAHRAAVAIHFSRKIPIIRVSEAKVRYDADYFKKRLLDAACLDYLVLEYAKLKGTVQAALIMPALPQKNNHFRQLREIITQSGKLVYSKNIPFPQSSKDGFSENFGPRITTINSQHIRKPELLSLILFETENSTASERIRERAQAHFRNSKSTIHFTTTQTEVIRQLNLLLTGANSAESPVRNRISRTHRWLVYKSKVLLLRTLKQLGLFAVFRKLYRTLRNNA